MWKSSKFVPREKTKKKNVGAEIGWARRRFFATNLADRRSMKNANAAATVEMRCQGISVCQTLVGLPTVVCMQGGQSISLPLA